MHPLDGARFKIVRAQEHLDSFKSEVRAYLEANPYESVIQVDDDNITAHRPRIIDPPLRIGGIAGDFACNCMASLDYIVWELARRYAGRDITPPPAGKDKPTFPLFNDDSRFTKNRHTLTKYKIPTAAIDIIASVQPYNTAYESLFLLYNLVNQDKHRLPLLSIGTLDDDKWTAFGITMEGAFTYATVPADFQWHGRASEDSVDVNVDAKVAIYIALADVGVPDKIAVVELENILKTVANIIPRFDQFFA